MTQKICKITIPDCTNVLISGVDPGLKKKITDSLKWRTANCYHTPKYKLGIWDGFIHLFKNGWTYANLLDDHIIGLIVDAGYEIDIVHHDNVAETYWPEQIEEDLFKDFPDKDGNPTNLRDYQVFAVNEAVREGNGIFVMATGAGKTITTAAIANQYMEYGKVIMIVPTIDLVRQTAKAFRYVGIDAGEFYGEEKIVNDVTISTWQSLINYPEIIEGVACIIADECHEYTAKEVFELLTIAAKNVPHRFGFTGTLPKDDLGLNQLRAALGPVLYTKEAYELQEEGYLSKCHINIIQTKEPDKNLGQYQTEMKLLLANNERTAFIAETIQEISETGNTLVLVDRVKYGEELENRIPDSKFMAGSGNNAVKSKDRDVHYSAINEGTNRVLICTYGIASTGIDIPRVFNLVIIEPGKAFTKVIQSIGRGLRLADDKDFAYIWDFCATTKFSNKHKNDRIKYYKEAKYPYSIQKVDYL